MIVSGETTKVVCLSVSISVRLSCQFDESTWPILTKGLASLTPVSRRVGDLQFNIAGALA